MQHRACVPELPVDQSTILMYGIGDGSPAADLLTGPESGSIGPAISFSEIRTDNALATGQIRTAKLRDTGRHAGSNTVFEASDKASALLPSRTSAPKTADLTDRRAARRGGNFMVAASSNVVAAPVAALVPDAAIEDQPQPASSPDLRSPVTFATIRFQNTQAPHVAFIGCSQKPVNVI